MLTIVTGTPGAGKTLHTLTRILKESEPDKGEDRRPVYVFGVPDLDYEYFHAKELKEPDKWYELPEGSLIFFDEGQHVFPQRPASQKVPEKCQQFSTHRHKGFDVFIATQDATNIDAFIRRMCGRHLHVHRILNRNVATIYEYDHYERSPTGYHEKKAAISVTPWRYPKKMYDKYKSATKHTYKVRTPWKLYALIGIVIFTGFVIYHGVNKFTKGNFAGKSADERLQEMDDTGKEPRNFLSVSPGSSGAPRNGSDFLSMYKPRVVGIQHSAPIYDSAFKVVAAPVPYCVIVQPFASGPGNDRNSSSCRCYTQQITHYETPDTYCRSWAVNGFFNPTIEVDHSSGGKGASASRPDAASYFN